MSELSIVIGNDIVLYAMDAGFSVLQKPIEIDGNVQE